MSAPDPRWHREMILRELGGRTHIVRHTEAKFEYLSDLFARMFKAQGWTPPPDSFYATYEEPDHVEPF